MEIVDPSAEFSDKSIRRGFIVKVYSILFVELAIAMGIICVFVFSEPVKEALLESKQIAVSLLFFGFFGFALIMYVFVCIPTSRKSVPLNFILLTVAAVSAALMLGVVSSIYETTVVLLAMSATFAIVASITVVAAVCPFDITDKGVILFVIGMVFSFALTTALIISFFMKIKLIWTILVAIGVLVISAFLLYDTQLIIGGGKVELSPEEYIFAAIILFSDIMNLYLYLLYLFGND